MPDKESRRNQHFFSSDVGASKKETNKAACGGFPRSGKIRIFYARIGNIIRLAFFPGLVFMSAMKDISPRRRVRRAVVTGIGVVSPVGIGIQSAWDNLLKGISGVRKISQFDASSYPCDMAAEVVGFSASDFLTRKEAVFFSRGQQFAIAAYKLAVLDAEIGSFEIENTGVLIGAAQIDFGAVEREWDEFPEAIQEYYPDQSPADLLQTIISVPSSLIANYSGARGYVSTVVSACSSGIDALNRAALEIIEGREHTMISGGVDTPITRIILNTFCKTKALSTEKEKDPSKVIRPFDHQRTKSVLGEGATILILEDLERAIARGAKIYCEIVPGAQGSENAGATLGVQKSGERWENILRKSMRQSGISRPDHINAHGPSDRFIDRLEIEVLRRIWGVDLKRIPITSIKGASAGAMAGTSSLQFAIAAKTILTGIIPPISNYEFPDPEMDGVDFVTSKRKTRPESVLVNTHGIGGMDSVGFALKI